MVDKDTTIINIYIRKGEHEVKKITFDNVKEYEIAKGLLTMELTTGKLVSYNLAHIEHFEEVYKVEGEV